MDETLEKEIPPTEVEDSDEGGIRRRLRDRELLKKRKAEAEEKATNQAQSVKRVKKKPSSSPGRKGRPRKEVVVIPDSEDVGQEVEPSSVTLPVTEAVFPTIVEPEPVQAEEPQPELMPVETISDKPLEGFLIEDLGPDEEEDLPQKSLVIDTGEDEQPCADLPEQRPASMPVFPPAPDPSQADSLGLSGNLMI